MLGMSTNAGRFPIAAAKPSINTAQAMALLYGGWLQTGESGLVFSNAVARP